VPAKEQSSSAAARTFRTSFSWSTLRRRQLNVPVTAETHEALRNWASDDGESLGTLVRRIIRVFLRHRRHAALGSRTGADRKRDDVTRDQTDLHPPTRDLKVWLDIQDLQALKEIAALDALRRAALVRHLLVRYVRRRSTFEDSRGQP